MSDKPSIDDDRPDDPTLAGEYVLGLVSAEERHALDRRVATDPAFARLVEDWAERLQPLADGAEAVDPPARVWSAIASSIQRPGAARVSPAGFWQSISFWRWATAISSAAAVAGFLTVVSLAPETPQTAFVASLGSPAPGPTFLARVDAAAGRLVIQPADMQAAAATVPELWVIPGDGRPRSLGVIAAAQQSQISVPRPLAEFLQAEATLAVSLEPPGGSPTGQPTGPVIAAGKLQKI